MTGILAFCLFSYQENDEGGGSSGKENGDGAH